MKTAQIIKSLKLSRNATIEKALEYEINGIRDFAGTGSLIEFKDGSRIIVKVEAV